jgi:selenocysteine-specific elongation factor
MPAIIGTAGHIDHGKTALIRALTGQDTDRLKEEKERGISIDLGFAYLELGDGSRAGIVDVPGHERFIRNMLAGAHGMDLVLLAVAADDGVMPQTEEHLEILHLLGVSRGLAVITKMDLVPPARVAEVRDEIDVLLAGTSLEGAPTVAVSAQTGEGLHELRAEIERLLSAAGDPAPAGLFRMPVDRAFVMKGHGVVVTGTAVSGQVREGEWVRLLPGGETCRVRHLQVHGADVGVARAGQRVALNLGGVERTEVGRGHVLVHPDHRRTTRRFDAAVEIRTSARRPLKTHAPVRVYLGTAEVLGKLIVLGGAAALAPKESGYAQIALDTEVMALHGDRFILRDHTGQRTLGGGRVLHPFAERHRQTREAADWLRQVEAAPHLGDVLAWLVQAADSAVAVDELCQAVPASGDEVVQCLREHEDLLLLPDATAAEAAMTRAAAAALEQRLVERLEFSHRDTPLAPGVDVESLRSTLAPALSPKLFRVLVEQIERRGRVARQDNLLRLPGHRTELASGDRTLAQRAEALLAAGRWTPPDLKAIEEALRLPRQRVVDLLAQLEREGRVVRVAADLYYAREALESARTVLGEHLRAHGEINAAAFRDLIQASRKFSIALLDYFDRTGFTLRVGDLRKLRR